MAQIPVFQDSQVLQPSSPVAIGNANTGAEEALAGVGKQMFILGNELDKNQKVAQAKTNQFRELVATEKFEEEMRLFNQKTLWEKHTNITGTDAARISIAEAEKVRSRLAKEFGFTGDQMLSFESKSRAVNNNLFPELMQQSSKIVQENYDSAKKEVLNLSISKVFNSPNPVNAFAEEAAKIEILVSKDPDILNKSEQIQKHQKDLAGSVVGSYIQKRQFDAAKEFVQKNSNVFGKDSDNQLQQIDKANIDWNNLVYTTGQRKETLRNQEFQKNRQEALSTYTTLLESAKNNQFAYNEAVAKAAADPRLTGEDISALSRNRIFMEVEDDIYEGNIMEKVYNKKINLQQANDTIEKDYIEGKVSADRRTKMLNSINNTKESQRKDPTLERLVTQYYARLEGLKDPSSMFDIEGRLYKGAVDKKNDIAKTDFAHALSKLAAEGRYNANTIENAFNRVIDNAYRGEGKGSFRGGTGKNKLPKGVDTSAIGDAQRAQELALQEGKYLAANSKTMTKAEIAELAARASWYAKQKNEALKKQRVNQITSPAKPSGGKRYDE